MALSKAQAILIERFHSFGRCPEAPTGGGSS